MFAVEYNRFITDGKWECLSHTFVTKVDYVFQAASKDASSIFRSMKDNKK